MSNRSKQAMHVVVLGGGVVGASIAWRVASRGATVTVVERSGIACAASGKAGGFLARDWCDGTPLMHLARRGFDLHAELADELGGDWGYRRLTAYGGRFARASSRAVRSSSREWTSSAVAITGQLGTSSSTAQVHPAAFTNGMMRAALMHGAELRLGRVTGLPRQGGDVVGVALDGEVIAADAVVIAMGPWSALAARWLRLPPVFGLKGHSIVFETGDLIPPEALFLEYEEAGGATLTPEIFPRPDGTTYVCAISSEAPLPVDPTSIAPDGGAMERLKALSDRISPVLATSRVVASGACFRPLARDGLPLIGAIAGARGAYVATGHGVWGILNAPSTAEAIAELILDGAATTIDLAPFDPARLPALDPGHVATLDNGPEP
jgi:glycine/D-amino acid oxidase-like deaminating enzyme